MRTSVLCFVALIATLPGRLLTNDLDRDKNVVLFPTFAPWDTTAGKVSFPVRGWIFEPEHESAWRGATLNQLCEILGVSADDRNSATFRA